MFLSAGPEDLQTVEQGAEQVVALVATEALPRGNGRTVRLLEQDQVQDRTDVVAEDQFEEEQGRERGRGGKANTN